MPRVHGSTCSIDYSRKSWQKRYCKNIFPLVQKKIFVTLFSINLQITSWKVQYKYWKIWETDYLCSLNSIMVTTSIFLVSSLLSCPLFSHLAQDTLMWIDKGATTVPIFDNFSHHKQEQQWLQLMIVKFLVLSLWKWEIFCASSLLWHGCCS